MSTQEKENNGFDGMEKKKFPFSKGKWVQKKKKKGKRKELIEETEREKI